MMYQNLVPEFYKDAPVSVHLCSFPEADLSFVDRELEDGMDEVLQIVILGRAARNAGNLKNRQPLAEMYVVTEKNIQLSEEEISIALEELNVKSFKMAKDADKFLSYKLKPQLKTLGPKYGKQLGAITKFLTECDGKEVVSKVKKNGSYTIPDLGVELLLEDLQIFPQSAEGFIAAEDRGITVALNSQLTEELILEGIERELVSKIQNMRKEAGFEVTDRIEVYYEADGKALKVLEKAAFASDVLAEKVACGKADGFTKEQNVNGEKVTLTLIKK